MCNFAVVDAAFVCNRTLFRYMVTVTGWDPRKELLEKGAHGGNRKEVTIRIKDKNVPQIWTRSKILIKRRYLDNGAILQSLGTVSYEK